MSGDLIKMRLDLVEDSVSNTFDFKDSCRLLWEASGDRKSWESGLTDRLAKRLMWLATQKVDDWNQATFEATLINYSHRAILLVRTV